MLPEMRTYWRHVTAALTVLVALTVAPAVGRRTSRTNTRDICLRDPPDVRSDSLPGDRGFRIQILGHAQWYAPGQVYTVVINGSYPNQKLSGFMLVAVPLHARDETTAMGTFQLIDTSTTRYVPNCPHVISDVTRHPKSFVEVLWTAPSSGAGCIEFRASVIERGETWYRDEGALTRVFCEDTRRTEGERNPEMVPDCCACGTAKYQVTFRGKWSQNSHPKDYPTHRRLLHWSNIVGASHSRNYMIWQYGAYASRGVKEVCELGYPRTVEDEIQRQSREVRSIIKTTGIWWSEPHGIDQSRSARFSTDRRRHLMSLLTMIGPSPDWCVGVSAVDLCLPNCTWAGDMTIELYPWDAGTDDGITYMSPNAKSEPQQKIHRITNQFPDNPRSPFHGPDPVRPLATLQIRRLNPPTTESGSEQSDGGVAGGSDPGQCTDNSDQEEVLDRTEALSDMDKQKLMMLQEQDGSNKCAVTPWDDWSACSVTCGVGQRVRKRAYINPMVDESMCGLPVMESENCIGTENECETVDEDCAMTSWSSWSPCSATCMKGTRQRRRYYLNKEDMVRCNRETEEIEMCIAEIMDCDKARMLAQSVAFCSLPAVVGPCRNSFQRWFYNSTAASCMPFIYGGCRGNGNNFESIDDCRRVCGDNPLGFVGGHQQETLGTVASATVTTPRPLSANVGGTSVCTLPRVVGSCGASIQSWYFDTAMGKCLPFTYGGCGGNSNRFATESQCFERCVIDAAVQAPQSVDQRPVTTTVSHPSRYNDSRTVRPSYNNERRLVNNTNNSNTRNSSTPIHCSVSQWSSWTECPTAPPCASGVTVNPAWKQRRREVLRRPANGGRQCPRLLHQRKKCDSPTSQPACDVAADNSCVMSPWSAWSPCSKTCGNDAVQERESHLIPAGTAIAGTDNSASVAPVSCTGPIRLLRRICTQLPPCQRVQSTPQTVINISRRSRSRNGN